MTAQITKVQPLKPFDTSHLHRLRNRLTRPGARNRRRAIQQYLQSFDARLAAVARANCTLHRAPNRLPLVKMQAIAEGLCAYRASDEPARVGVKVKENGDYRLFVSFGIENRALQYMCSDVLRCTAELHPQQCVMKGIKTAIGTVAKFMTEGYVWAVELDIKDCFPSFDGDEIENLLPFPKKVTRSVILSRNLNLVPGHSLLDVLGFTTYSTSAEEVLKEYFVGARRGIPQGSAASSLVAEILISLSLKALPPHCAICCYADNILIMGRSEAEVDSIATALRCSLLEHPVGSLQPREVGRFGPGQKFEFLGHQIGVVNGTLQIMPSNKRRNQFNHRLQECLLNVALAASLVERERHAQIAKAYIRNWCSAFGLCSEIQALRATSLAKIAKCAAGKHTHISPP